MLINLTPHDIILRDADGVDFKIPKSGTEARVTVVPGELTEISGIPVPVMTPDSTGTVTGLPDPSPGNWFLVSGLVGTALAGTRKDILVPGTGPLDEPVRNEKGWIVAVTRLKMV